MTRRKLHVREEKIFRQFFVCFVRWYAKFLVILKNIDKWKELVFKGMWTYRNSSDFLRKYKNNALLIYGVFLAIK